MSINKSLFISIFLCILSTGLFAQLVQSDSVFTESEIILKTPTGDISGTLTIPNNVQSSPVVLIIAGSGPTDRDCNSPMGIKTNAYKMLAGAFAGNGISTLRFDKRGIGNSKAAMTGEADLRFETYINDVVSWISLLKADQRFSNIILLGHSEGSLIGIVAAELTEVAGLISVAGAGKPADQILKDQLKTKLTPQMLAETNILLDSLKAGYTVSHFDPALNMLFRPSVQPYMISWMKYDPATEISKLKIPVLIIQGTTDIQVSVDDAKLLAAVKPDAKLLIIDNMNHILKEAPADFQANVATYQDPKLPLKDGLVKELIDFIKAIK
jgi:uncharacterized protein